MNKTIYWLVTLTIITGVLFTGCSANETKPNQANVNTPPASEKTEDTASNSESKKFTDGTYTETGSYSNPSGTDTVKVTVTVKEDLITKLELSGEADDEKSKKFQALFIGGINEMVVGKNIAEISKFDRVNGSSLTPIGFQQAIEAIKQKAQA